MSGVITQEQVFDLFHYVDGVLYWKKRRGRAKKGGRVGNINANGRLLTSLKGKRLYVHRVIFMYHHGYLPKYLDHIDGNPLNNKIENLRECTIIQNGYNRKINKNNATGIKGVC